jgi:protein-S-isoprenylcysteine O-methyltransferase Ste14
VRMAAAAPADEDDEDDRAPRQARSAAPAAEPGASGQEQRPEQDAQMFTAPSFDTTVFSDFVDSAQSKIDELQTQLSDIDSQALGEDAKAASIGLVDNLIAGDWLNRGELYGAVQILFAILLLRTPGFLDGIIGFVVGPATLFAGAGIAVKAIFDLGRKQLSIWPAPVPGAELKTGGLYNVVRHPLYAGVLLSTFGYATATASPERVALAVAFAVFLAKKISVEEEYLCDTYPEYPSYQDNVPFKLIPRIF